MLRPFQQHFSHIGTMVGKGDNKKAVCNGTSFMFGKMFTSGEARIRNR